MPLEIAFCNIIVVCLLAVSMLSAAVGVGLLLSMLGAVCFLVHFFITQVAIFIFVAFIGVADGVDGGQSGGVAVGIVVRVEYEVQNGYLDMSRSSYFNVKLSNLDMSRFRFFKAKS